MTNVAYNVAFAALVGVPVIWLSRSVGLPWWAVGTVAIVALAGAWRFLAWQPFGKKQSRFDIEHGVKSLALIRENGGWLDVRHRDSPFRLQIFRESGDGAAAEVLISVPRESWSAERAAELEDLLERQDRPFAVDPSQLSHESSLLEVRIHLRDIWDEAVGAEPAHVTRLILDLFGLGPSELFDFRLEGEASNRIREHLASENA